MLTFNEEVTDMFQKKNAQMNAQPVLSGACRALPILILAGLRDAALWGGALRITD